MKKIIENEEVVFDARKNMKFIRNLGDGGTGEAKLFYDQSVDMYFAIKNLWMKLRFYFKYSMKILLEYTIIIFILLIKLDIFKWNI